MELKIIDPKEDKNKELFSTEECQQLLSMYDDFYPKMGFHIPWVGYFIIKNNQVVGSCGFTGKPINGEVEIAYWTFKEFEGLGIAFDACKALINIVIKTDPTLTIIAKTAPETNASTKVLTKNGFVFSSVVVDDGIGDAWLWTLSLPLKRQIV